MTTTIALTPARVDLLTQVASGGQVWRLASDGHDYAVGTHGHRRVTARLRDLIAAGLVERDDSRRGQTYWQLTDHGRWALAHARGSGRATVTIPYRATRPDGGDQ